MNKPNPPAGAIDLKTAEQRFQIPTETLLRWTATGGLRCQKVSRKVFIRPEDLTAALKASGRPGREVVA